MGDYVFYVLPRSAELPQMVYSFLRVADIITHEEAFRTPSLEGKRMRKGKNPNGNIIVNAKGDYHPADAGVHRDRFKRIRKRYVVGDPEESEFLLTDTRRLRRLAGDFVATLNRILGKTARTPFVAITRYGRTLNEGQTKQLLSWLRG